LTEKELDGVLKRSKAIEFQLVPEFFKTGGGEALESSFRQKVEHGDFCSIDLNRLFNDEYWIIYLLSTFNSLQLPNALVQPEVAGTFLSFHDIVG
jgi:hypothetical protein